MGKKYNFINTIIGVIVGIVASAIYIMTAEPTVSWWDCGEYIATTTKMLVGHPLGHLPSSSSDAFSHFLPVMTLPR